MELRRQVGVLWRAKWFVLAVCVIATAFAYYFTSLQPKVYEATATAIVGQALNVAGVNINSLDASERLSDTYATLATTRPLLASVIAKEGLTISPDDLRKQVSASAPLNSSFVLVTVDDRSPDGAAALANDIINELVLESPTIQGRENGVQQFIDDEFAATQQDITSVRSEVDGLSAQASLSPDDSNRLQQLRNDLASLRQAYSNLLPYSSSTASNGLSVIEPADAPLDPSSPRILVDTILGLLAGFFLALGIVFLRDYLDDTVKRPEDVEGLVGVPALGAIARMRGRRTGSKLVTRDDARSPIAEAFGTLSTNIDFARVDSPVTSVLVTSPSPGDGKSTVAANLAVAFAHAGRTTLLIDADLRQPNIHKMFGLTNGQGLTTLARFADESPDKVIQKTDVVGLSVLTSGPIPVTPAAILRSQRMVDLMATLRSEGYVIVIDSPPVAGLSDAMVLATLSDATILVVRAGHTRTGTLRRATEALVRVDAPLLGVVLNQTNTASEQYSYYYARPSNEPEVAAALDPK